MRGTRLSRLALAGILLAQNLAAQTSPASGPIPAAASTAPADDIPLPDYLGLLRQIAPAAEAGARTYLGAVMLRCRHALTAAELRQAFAGGEGNPTLMGLIRAAHAQDTAARDRLIAHLPCPRGESR